MNRVFIQKPDGNSPILNCHNEKIGNTPTRIVKVMENKWSSDEIFIIDFQAFSQSCEDEMFPFQRSKVRRL